MDRLLDKHTCRFWRDIPLFKTIFLYYSKCDIGGVSKIWKFELLNVPIYFLCSFNAEETLRRQKENRDKRKAFEAAEERHRKETLNQRKQQQRQVLTQAKVTTSEYSNIVV